MRDPLTIPVKELSVTIRLHNAMLNSGCRTLGGVISMTEAEWYAVPNLGRKSIQELKELLAAHGLQLAADPRRSFIATPPKRSDPIERIASALERIADHLDRHAAEG